MNNDKYFDDCCVPTSDFDKSYARHNYFWNLAASCFNNNSGEKSCIPDLIHFIWLGGKMPEWYAYNIANWQKNLPEFQIKIWTDEESDDLMLKTRYSAFYRMCENLGMKSDLLRYHILHKYGGLYMDTDFVCVRPNLLRQIHKSSRFYSSAMFDRDLLVTNGFMGCEMGHPILEDVTNSLSGRIFTYQKISCPFTRILYQTGPHAITTSVIRFFENAKIKIMPSSFIFPFPAVLRNDGLKNTEITSYFNENTIACHLWHTSWQGETKGYLGEVESFLQKEENEYNPGV